MKTHLHIVVNFMCYKVVLSSSIILKNSYYYKAVYTLRATNISRTLTRAAAAHCRDGVAARYGDGGTARNNKNSHLLIQFYGAINL